MCQSRKEDELNAGKIEIGTDRSLFDGLAILQETALCEEYMGKFPVIFISLKGVDGLSFANARDMLWEIILKELRRLQYLLQDSPLSQLDKESFIGLMTAGQAILWYKNRFHC